MGQKEWAEKCILGNSSSGAICFGNVQFSYIGSIAQCNVRITGDAIIGSINWIPKWYHGDPDMGRKLVAEFPEILARGLTVPSAIE